MGNPFYRGPYAYGSPVPLSGGTVGFVANLTGGTQQVVLPDYSPLTVSAVGGLAATVNAGALLMTTSGYYLLEARSEIKNSYGEYVVFGCSVNGAAPRELSRAQCNSNDFTFVITARKEFQLNEGDEIAFLISSTFAWAEFSWRNTEIMGISDQG